MNLSPLALTLAPLLAPAPPQDAPDPPAASEPADPFVRHTLSVEVELCVLHVPDARTQSVFAIYERGFFSDQKGTPQSAHLAEHLAIRSTDPDALEVDGVRLNGETQGSTLRLEALGPVAAWPTMVDRLARWMAAKDVNPAVLDVELERMAGEVESTAPRGFTGKWAQAAWLQAVRHGADEVRLRDGLAEIPVPRAGSLLAWHVRNSRPVRIVVVGPREPEDVREDLAEALKDLPGWSTGTSIGSFGIIGSTWQIPTGDHAAQWDLPGPHYVEWYTLPAAEPADRAAGEALAGILRANLQRAGVAREGTFIAVTLERLSYGTWGLWISFAPPVGMEPSAVRAALDEELERLRAQPKDELLKTARWMTAMQPLVPDFEALREQMAGKPGAELIEAQVALNLADQEARTGISAVELRRLVKELTADGFEAFASKTLGPENRGTLWLSPGD